jgi:hypothetical protein
MFRTETVEMTLFDRFVIIRKIISKSIDRWNNSNISISDRCKEIFLYPKNNHFEVKDVINIVEFVLCLPGNIASVERIFSLMNMSWTKEKSRLSIETMKSILIIKQNCNISCEQFYNKIITDTILLGKIE